MPHPLELKIPPLVLVSVLALVMWFAAAYTPGWPGVEPLQTWLPRGLLAAGALLMAMGAVAFRQHHTTVDPTRPDNASALVTSGVYRVTRNPMYLGMLLVLLAWGVALKSPVALLVVAGFVLYMNRFQISPEERALRTRFGKAFDDYCRGVRRWL